MKVKVKKGQKGFIYGTLRREGTELTLKPIKHSTEKDEKGKAVVIPAKDQFSAVWMEKVDGRKKTTEQEEQEPEQED